ncbi:MAG: DUF1990 family protein [Leucobacter sp.]|nr:DUF1990 family protein [Leucobacter sp.]
MSEAAEPTRRSTFVDHEAVYAAVGASASPDLQRFPPEGSSPFEHALKIGSGASRFLTATNTLMTWGAQRAAGVEIADISDGDAPQYAGVVFDTAGNPEAAPAADVNYGPDGEAFLTAGVTATLTWPHTKFSRRVRVVYVIDETHRSGFAIGTADDAGVVGETAFFVEHRDDDSVWAVTRGFYWAPTAGLLKLKARAATRLAQKSAISQINALAPGIARGATTEGP